MRSMLFCVTILGFAEHPTGPFITSPLLISTFACSGTLGEHALPGGLCIWTVIGMT